MARLLVLTLQDILSAFRPALSRLPSTPESMKAMRALTMFVKALDELYATMEGE